MKEMILSNNSIFAVNRDDLSFRQTKSRWSAVLIVSAVLGIVSGLGGLVLGAASWFFSDIANGIGGVSTMLTVAFFPMMILVAHSLDKIRGAEKALKLAECRRSGLKGENC